MEKRKEWSLEEREIKWRLYWVVIIGKIKDAEKNIQVNDVHRSVFLNKAGKDGISLNVRGK